MIEQNLLSSAFTVFKRLGTTFKVAGISFLILLLLIPLRMVQSVLHERLERRNEAVANITGSWGREQKLVGPVLVVPYRYVVKTVKEKLNATGRMENVESSEMVVGHACFLPSKLAVHGQIAPTKLKRGIYEAVVYHGKLELAGEFAKPDWSLLKVDEKNVLWDEALVTLAIPDLRGVRERLKLNWDDRTYSFLSGSKLKGWQSGLYAKVDGLHNAQGAVPFRTELTLNGSGGLSFAPVGTETTVTLSSPWPNPSFYGAVLPTERKVESDGFKASWNVSSYARDYAQQWTEQDHNSSLNPASAEASLFGVTFLSGIDSYRNTERAIKYGALFVVLIFAVFFLFEVLAGLRIHPFQYAIVGVALCLFYLGLLSLSEFVSFGVSYLTAAAATVLLICFHCATMLRGGQRTAVVGLLLTGIYGYLYVALQLQDYALLLGTAGLFLVLTAVVIVTRKIDWYSWDKTATAAASPEC